jgi:hypothetical protein
MAVQLNMTNGLSQDLDACNQAEQMIHSFIHSCLLVKIPIQGHMTQDKDNSRITIIQEARIQKNKTDVKIYCITLA